MQKLVPVEDAKALMTEAQDWSMWSWLTEKRRLRTTADSAWVALEAAEAKVRSSWSDELKAAGRLLDKQSRGNGQPRSRRPEKKDTELAPEIRSAIGRWLEEAAEADAARLDAEDTFDRAERRMSTAMACEGARKAIAAWEMREKVIRKAEALGRKVAQGRA